MPKGGVARRATIINQVRSASNEAILVLDAGNTLFGQRLANETEGRIIVEAMNAMGYDAVAVGQLDLSRGIEVLLQRASEAQFPLLSCNIVWSQDGDPVFAPYAVVERDGTRFGILGVSELEVMSMLEVGGAVEVIEPVVGVRKYLPEVRARSDVVILLSRLGLEADQELARTVDGIDVIVGGRSRILLTAPVLIDATVIVQAGYDGEWLGRLDVSFSAQEQAIDPQVTITTLGPEVPDEPVLAALMASYKQRFPAPTPASD